MWFICLASTFQAGEIPKQDHTNAKYELHKQISIRKDIKSVTGISSVTETVT